MRSIGTHSYRNMNPWIVFEPTEIILKYLYDKIVMGGIIIFDDYALIDGETKAIDEFFEKQDVLFEKLTFLEKPTFIRKKYNC